MADKMDAPYVKLDHCHDGIWYPNFVLDSSIEALPNFEVRTDDVWILTFPKAGTHWMLEIVGLILNDGFPERIDRATFSSTIEMINMDQTFPSTKAEETENPTDMSPFMNLVEKMPSPRVIITHLRRHRLPKDVFQKAKVIYLARNPKDITTSWYSFFSNSDSINLTWESNFEAFLNGRMYWGPWPEHIKEYWDIREEGGIQFIFYEDLLRDPMKQIRDIADHIGHPLPEDTLQRVVDYSSLTKMKKTYHGLAETGKTSLTKAMGTHEFLQKGKIGQWKNRFTVSQNEMFDKWYQENMEGTHLKFSFE